MNVFVLNGVEIWRRVSAADTSIHQNVPWVACVPFRAFTPPPHLLPPFEPASQANPWVPPSRVTMGW